MNFPPVSGIIDTTFSASLEAAEKIEPNAETLRSAVLAHIQCCGELGATDDEIQAALGLSGNTERPRRWELFKADRIYANGHRMNGRGRKCTVWCAVGEISNASRS